MTEPDLLAIADELYALPLAEFTPARDARAKELKGTDVAARVKALKKPSVAAWVVDLLVRRDAEQVEQVLAVGSRLREAQEGMAADRLRELTRQRRQLTAAVTQQARSLAHEERVKVTQSVTEQVEATLTAAMVDERCGQAVRSGLLVAALSSTGVEEVDVEAAVAVPEALGHAATPRAAAAPEEPAPPDLHVVPDPDAEEKARAAAHGALADAQAALDQSQTAYDDAAAEVDQLRARQLQVEAEIDELKRKVAELEESYDQVDDRLDDAQAVREEASAALEAATSDRDAAAAEVDRLR